MNISPEDFIKKLLNNKHLPEGLVVEGDLCLSGCTSLTHLPEGLVVNGWLDLRNCTSLTHFPSSISVKGTVYCDESLIDKVPYKDLPLYINFNFEEGIYEHLIKRFEDLKKAKPHDKLVDAQREY